MAPQLLYEAIVALGVIGHTKECRAVIEHHGQQDVVEVVILDAFVDSFYPQVFNVDDLLGFLHKTLRGLETREYRIPLFVHTIAKRTLPRDLHQLVSGVRDIVLQLSDTQTALDAGSTFLFLLYREASVEYARHWQPGADTDVIHDLLGSVRGRILQKFKHLVRTEGLQGVLADHMELRKALFRTTVFDKNTPVSTNPLMRAWTPGPADETWLTETVRSASFDVNTRRAAMGVLLRHYRIFSIVNETILQAIADDKGLQADYRREVEVKARNIAMAVARGEEERTRNKQEDEQTLTWAIDMLENIRGIREGLDVRRLFELFVRAMQDSNIRYLDASTLRSRLDRYGVFDEVMLCAAERGLRSVWRVYDLEAEPLHNSSSFEFALTSISLDMELGLDVSVLSSELAERGAEYGIRDPRSIPDWMARLALAHPMAVRLAMDKHLFAGGSDQVHVLRKLLGGPSEVRKLCVDIVKRGLEGGRVRSSKAEEFALFVVYRTSFELDELAQTCEDKCATSDEPQEYSTWWSAWFMLRPAEAFDHLISKVDALGGQGDSGRTVLLEVASSLAGWWPTPLRADG